MNALNDIKIKTIHMFLNFLNNVEKGYQPDYDFILHNISFIQSYSELGKITSIYEHLMSHE